MIAHSAMHVSVFEMSSQRNHDDLSTLRAAAESSPDIQGRGLTMRVGSRSAYAPITSCATGANKVLAKQFEIRGSVKPNP
jgi:hypothetical protein